MQQYVAKRLVFGGVTVLLVTMILFLLVNAMPGDVIETQAAGYLSADEIDEYRHDVGLDKPINTGEFHS